VRKAETRSAILAGPSLFLAVALALSGPLVGETKGAGGDRQASIAQQTALRDTMLPPASGKPAARKPMELLPAKFVGSGSSVSPTRDPDAGCEVFGFINRGNVVFSSSMTGERGPPAPIYF
jgi:hypothetical protein